MLSGIGPWARMIVVALGVVMFAPLSGHTQEAKKPGGPPPMRIIVDQVRIQAMQQTVPVIGRLVPRKRGIVAARINGPVANFSVEVGDRVEEGQVIAELAADRLTWERALKAADVARYKAASKTATETLKLRQQELKRLEGLRKSAAFSQARLDDKRQEVAVAQAEIAEAEAQLQSARASFRLAEIELDYATTRAPYSGVVSIRHTEKGAYVRSGDPLVTLIDDSNLEVEIDVPARNIKGIVIGAEIPVSLTDGRVFIARVRAVVPEENPQTRTQTVRLTLSDRDQEIGGKETGDQGPRPGTQLAANQSVTVDVPAAAASAVVTISKDAVLNRQGRTNVFVIIDNKAVSRPVQLGEAVGSRFVVLSGVKEGDLVAIRGNERLRPNQAVRVDSAAPANAATPVPPKTGPAPG